MEGRGKVCRFMSMRIKFVIVKIVLSIKVFLYFAFIPTAYFWANVLVMTILQE